MAGTDRVTKAGAYIEAGGAALQATKAGVYVEISEPQDISTAVTQAGAYIEITNAMDRVSMVGLYVEMHQETQVTKAGAYIEFLAPPPNPPTLALSGDFTASLSSFDFLPIVAPSFVMTPVRWSWQRFGGCNVAEIRVDGELASLLAWLPELPRMPVSIINPIGSTVWLGYINGVEVTVGDLILSVTLDGLANRVIVAYQELAEGDTTPTDALTTLAADAESVARYGKFELLYTYSETASADQANALRDRILADLSAIQSDTRLNDSGDMMASAKLLCAGWIHSFAWQIYDESGTSNTTIGDQVGAVASAMQFVNVLDFIADNTIESNPYTEPIAAYDKLAALLDIADQDGDMRRCSVPQAGVFRYEKEFANEDALLYIGGKFTRSNHYPLQPGEAILGWGRDVGVRTVGNLANANRFYVEESEYEAETGQYTIRTRGTQSPWR